MNLGFTLFCLQCLMFFCTKGFCFPNSFLSFLHQFDKYTPKLDNPFIRHSNVSFLCNSYVNLVFAFGKSNIWHIWMLPWEHFLWLWLSLLTCLSPVCVSVWFSFLCPPHPSSSVIPSSSPPIPQPCQACPRCSHTQDPSARCKEPFSPRSDPPPHPHLTGCNRHRI